MNRKILIIGPSWVGDMVMAQVLFKLLKEQDKDCEIHVLAPDWSLPILERMPEVAKSICLPIKHGEFALFKRFDVAKQLRHENYQHAIVLANSWKSALIPWLANIPKRTGWIGEMRFGLLNDFRFNKQVYPMMVQRYAALGIDKNAQLPKELPSPKLTATTTTVANIIAKFNIDTDTKILALCPGAAYGPAKRWPEKYFIQIAQDKMAQGWQVWLFGSNQDNDVIATIQNNLIGKSINFAGQINLMETVDLLSLANAVVTNDSGLLHIAASLDKPLVAIYGSTSAKFTPPLGVKSKVLQEELSCRPCFKRECPLQHLQCMHLITPQKVLAALDELETV